MVHVYAGNLLMTTGAYSDAIKAYENAETVELTADSQYQRARCYCALNNLPEALKILSDVVMTCPDDLLLKYDFRILQQIQSVQTATLNINKPN